jgi:penicillin-binding protein 1B
MRDVVRSGTGSDMKNMFGHYEQIPFAGKTGTTQNNADVWFIGYTPDVTVGVWAGYEQSKHSLTKSGCSKTAGCGTQRAKQIWAKVMDASIKQQPDLFESAAFDMPSGLVKETVSRYTGLLPTKQLLERKDVVTDLFDPRYVPTEVDDRAGMTSYTIVGGVPYLAQPETPEDMIYRSFLVQRQKPIQEMMKEVEAGLARMPAGQRKSLSHYYPVDAELDGPSKVDPRVDDGQSPIAPTEVKFSGNNHASVSFKLNGEPDVVGYRIYGSNDGKDYAYIAGKPVSSESEAVFNMSGDNHYMFVVTAVDVAGRESNASDIVFNESKSIEKWFSEYFNNKNLNKKNGNKKKNND